MSSRRLSSSFTCIEKFFPLSASIVGLVILIFFLFLPSGIDISENLIFIIIFLFLLLYVYFAFVPLKSVRLDDEYLVISNYLRTIEVPFSEIKNVFEVPYSDPNPKDKLEKSLRYRHFFSLLPLTYRIFITFENPTEFGEWIMFAPYIPRRLSSYTGGEHEIVKELKDLAGIVTQDS